MAKQTFTGITKKEAPITAAQVWQFINEKAGGNPTNVRIVVLPNVDKKSATPLPYTNTQRAGKRATINLALVQGGTLAEWNSVAVANGASKAGLGDLLAALNGGYTPSSKFWGTPYIRLEA